MPIKITYDNQLKILTGTIVGRLTLEDFEKTIVDLISSTEYPADVNAIWDLTEMEFDNIDIEFEQKLIALRQPINHKRGTAKLALVSKQTLADPVIKLYTILSKDLSQPMQTFRTIEEARSWLCESNNLN